MWVWRPAGAGVGQRAVEEDRSPGSRGSWGSRGSYRPLEQKFFSWLLRPPWSGPARLWNMITFHSCLWLCQAQCCPGSSHTSGLPYSKLSFTVSLSDPASAPASYSGEVSPALVTFSKCLLLSGITIKQDLSIWGWERVLPPMLTFLKDVMVPLLQDYSKEIIACLCSQHSSTLYLCCGEREIILP